MLIHKFGFDTKNFLLLDEIEKSSKAKLRPALSECLIELNQLTVKWPAAGEKEDNTLTDISFNVRPGQVFAIVGQVGCGKVMYAFGNCSFVLCRTFFNLLLINIYRVHY